MKKEHLYAAVIILTFLAAGIQPVCATTWVIGPDQEPPVIPPVTIGTWNGRTFTLADNTPLGDNIQIIDDSLTLDGAGYKITGSGSSAGVDVPNRSGVTIKNLNVTGCGSGIALRVSNNCTVTDNTVLKCDYGIWLAGSSDNTVTGNILTGETYTNAGIWLQEGYQAPPGLWVGSDENTLTSNTITGVSDTQGNGIYIQNCSYNSLTSNTVSNNLYGIRISNSNGTTLTNNTAENNSEYGIELSSAKDYTLTENTVSENLIGIYLYGCNDPTGFGTLTKNIAKNNSTGIQLQSSSYNTVTGNTISDNNWGIRIRAYNGQTSIENQVYNNNFENENTPGQQAEVYKEGTGNIYGNVFNLEKPTGGNHWCDCCQPDDDGDGFVDNPPAPYVFTGGQDEYPWTCQDGWLNPPPTNQPPVADAGTDPNPNVECACQTEQGTQVTLDGTGSYDPDGDPLTYTWSGPFDESPTNEQNPNVTLDPGCLGDYVITLVVYDGELYSDQDTVTITVLDTTPPIISCPGNTTIVDPDGVPVDDHRIQTFLAGAAADDDCDPSPVIGHDAPAVFPPGYTIVVTFTATDASGNTSDCESTVTVVEPAEAIEPIIDVLEDMVVPEDAEKEMDKAVKELNKAIDEFNNDRIDKALNKIAKAVKELMKAQEKGASTQGVQDVIDQLVALVQGIAEEAIEDAIGAVGADNLHVVKAQEHYDTALGNLADEKYDAAIKKFKNAYREAMKALGE